MTGLRPYALRGWATRLRRERTAWTVGAPAGGRAARTCVRPSGGAASVLRVHLPRCLLPSLRAGDAGRAGGHLRGLELAPSVGMPLTARRVAGRPARPVSGHARYPLTGGRHSRPNERTRKRGPLGPGQSVAAAEDGGMGGRTSPPGGSCRRAYGDHGRTGSKRRRRAP